MSSAGQSEQFGVFPRPGRLWSLLDMINFSFGAANQAINQLNNAVSASKKNMSLAIERGGGDYLFADEKFKGQVREVAEIARSLFQSLQSSHVDISLRHLVAFLHRERIEWSEINTLVRNARDIIDTECRQHKFVMYDRDEGMTVDTYKDEWASVIYSFEVAEGDVFAAVDCCALGHYTASAFHVMRVLEYGLSWLSNDVGVSFEIESWQTIIERIEAKIREEGKSLPRGIKKTERLRFLSEAAKEFIYFKDGWRNHVSHNRATYDVYQARRILEHVKSFMTLLSHHINDDRKAKSE